VFCGISLESSTWEAGKTDSLGKDKKMEKDFK